MASTEQEAVQVALRLRPLSATEEKVARAEKRCLDVLSDTEVLFRVPAQKSAKRAKSSSSGGKRLRYSFSQVFDESTTQTNVFDGTTRQLVKDVLAGQNALLFTYGITNSGKTYTMQGTETEGGLLSRSLDIIFNSIYDCRADWFTFRPDKQNRMQVQPRATAAAQRTKFKATHDEAEKLMSMSQHDISIQHQRAAYDPTQIKLTDPDCRYAVFVSYVEIYKEMIFDLLDESPMKETTGWNVNTDKIIKDTKMLREDKDGHVFVSNVIEKEVHSTEEAFELMKRGQTFRQVAATNVNSVSSRSHSIFNIRLVRVPLNKRGSDIVRSARHPPHVSQFSLVDLAGSERTSRTNSQGERRKEAAEINKSLMTLRRCMQSLRDNQKKKKKIVPFRESLLTKMFKNYLCGDGKVSMVVCASPSVLDEEETAHVLKFSALTQAVTTSVTKTPIVAPQGATPGRGKAFKASSAAMDEEEDGEDEFEDCIEQLQAAAQQADKGAKRKGKQKKVEAAKASSAAAASAADDTDAIDDVDIMSLNLALVKPLLKAQSAYRQALQEHERRRKRQEALMQRDQEELAERQIELQQLREQAKERRTLESHKVEQRRSVVEANEQAIVEMGQTLKSLKRQSKSLKTKMAQQAEELHKLSAVEVEEQEAVADLQQQSTTLQKELEALQHATSQAQHELVEKDSLAEAEMNKMEIELQIALEQAEEAAVHARSDLDRQRKATSKLAYKLDMVKDVFQTGSPPDAKAAKQTRTTKRRRAASRSPVRELKRAAVDPTAAEDESKENQLDMSVQALSTNNPEGHDAALLAAAKESAKKGKGRRKGSAPLVLNHTPGDFVALDTIMTPVIHAKQARNVETPTVKQLMSKRGKAKCDKYILNHQDHEGEHQLFKGEVQPSVTKTGVSVTFTGLESLTTAPTLGPITRKRRGRAGRAAKA